MRRDYIQLPSHELEDYADPAAISFNDFPPHGPHSSWRPNLPSKLSDERTRTLKLALIGGSVLATLLLGIIGIVTWGTQGDESGGLGSYAGLNLGQWSSPYGKGREVAHNEGLLEPTYRVDPESGYSYPPDVYPAALNPYKRANAAFVVLVRNQELEAMKESMRSVEEKFNRKFGYPWVFLNDKPFTDEFKKGVLSMTRSKCTFGLIPEEHWSYPSWVNQTYAQEERQKMMDENIIYGGSEPYRMMCRFNSGFFFKQEVLLQYDYYWRVEPGVQFFCDLDYDPFLFMEVNKKVYSFTITMYEYERTIQSLWTKVQDFTKLHPEYVDPDNAIDYIVDDGKGIEGRSNFEIADMRFWRSQVYQDYFKYLDDTGNFFYERWGDAPVHSLAAVLFLPKDKIHFWNDIAYRHPPYTHCPVNQAKYFDNGKCNCKPEESFDNDGYSCMRQWWRVGKQVTRKV